MGRVVLKNPNSRKITFNGETLTIYGWAKRLGISTNCLYLRFNYGWPVEKALTAPPKRKKVLAPKSKKVIEANRVKELYPQDSQGNPIQVDKWKLGSYWETVYRN